MKEPPDVSKNRVDTGEVDRFRSSTKTARSPPQTLAEPGALTKDNHASPHVPHPLTGVKKLQPVDFTQSDDDSDGMTKPEKLMLRQPIEMLTAIREMVISLHVNFGDKTVKERILKPIAEVIDVLTMVPQELPIKEHISNIERCMEEIKAMVNSNTNNNVSSGQHHHRSTISAMWTGTPSHFTA